MRSPEIFKKKDKGHSLFVDIEVFRKVAQTLTQGINVEEVVEPPRILTIVIDQTNSTVLDVNVTVGVELGTVGLAGVYAVFRDG
jgi:hypothetical protein